MSSSGWIAIRANLFLTVMLVVSVTLNVGLAHKMRELDGRLEVLQGQRQLQPGTTAPTFTAQRLGGETDTITYTVVDRPTVLYVFSPRCSWCEVNLASIKTLMAEREREYRFIGISLVTDGTDRYVVEKGLTLPVYTGISNAVRKAYKMGGTPQTIVVSPQGVVLKSWNGAYLGKQKSQLEEFFHLTLPDIKMPEPPRPVAGAPVSG